MYFKYLRYLAFALGGLYGGRRGGALFLYATFDGARLAAELSHFAKAAPPAQPAPGGAAGALDVPRLMLRAPAAACRGGRARASSWLSSGPSACA